LARWLRWHRERLLRAARGDNHFVARRSVSNRGRYLHAFSRCLRRGGLTFAFCRTALSAERRCVGVSLSIALLDRTTRLILPHYEYQQSSEQNSEAITKSRIHESARD
jgi:hypothetical protein